MNEFDSWINRNQKELTREFAYLHSEEFIEFCEQEYEQNWED